MPSQPQKTLKPPAQSLLNRFDLNPRDSTHLKHPLEAGINQGIAIKVTEGTGTEGYLYIVRGRERGPCADKAQTPRETQKAIPKIPASHGAAAMGTAMGTFLGTELLLLPFSPSNHSLFHSRAGREEV